MAWIVYRFVALTIKIHTMQIMLNGQAFETENGTTISVLLNEADIVAKRYAVEVNQTIIPRSEHANHELSAGDKVEIVVAIGGG